MIKPTIEQKEKFLRNEQNNFHSENVVLLAKISGNQEYIKKAEEILQAHIKNGHMSLPLLLERDELQRTLESLIDVRS